MLCFEGIALNLNIFLGRVAPPNFRVVEPKSEQQQTITVLPDTTKVRPYVAGAVLRNIKFTQDRYDSFIALQDKLHQNLARNRTLVSMGTHDLDTVQGPFTYEALPPKDIKFKPLNQTKEMNGEELMNFYENDKHLGRFLHIIRDAPVYPVIYDANRVVCSLPPIINGEHSKITLNTTNVFIEITATDLTKLKVVTDMLVTMFSMYCAEPFTVEPVKIVSEHNDLTRITPTLKPRVTHAEVDYLNSCTGLNESPESLCKLLTKMAYESRPSDRDSNLIEIAIPPPAPTFFTNATSWRTLPSATASISCLVQPPREVLRSVPRSWSTSSAISSELRLPWLAGARSCRSSCAATTRTLPG